MQQRAAVIAMLGPGLVRLRPQLAPKDARLTLEPGKTRMIPRRQAFGLRGAAPDLTLEGVGSRREVAFQRCLGREKSRLSFCSCGVCQADLRWLAGLDALRRLHGNSPPGYLEFTVINERTVFVSLNYFNGTRMQNSVEDPSFENPSRSGRPGGVSCLRGRLRVSGQGATRAQLLHRASIAGMQSL